MLRRERAHASDFNAALHEHQQYLRRRVRPPTFLGSLAAHVFGDHPTSNCMHTLRDSPVQMAKAVLATHSAFDLPCALQREAEAMRQQYESDTSGGGEDGAGPRQQRDYRLQEGQTLHIALPDKVSVNAMAAAAFARGAARPRTYRKPLCRAVSTGEMQGRAERVASAALRI